MPDGTKRSFKEMLGERISKGLKEAKEEACPTCGAKVSKSFAERIAKSFRKRR